MEQHDNMFCHLCRRETKCIKYRLRTYRIAYCLYCNFLFNADFPSGKCIKETFSESYYLDVQKEAFEKQFEDYTLDVSYHIFQKRLQYIESIKAPGKVLDIGCAFGTFLKIASDRGWKPYGVEISTFASEYTRNKYGFEIYNDSFLDAPLPSAFFDVVTFWDVIEHVEFPKENLLKAYDVLKPEGILLLTSDNYDCLMATMADTIDKLSFGKIGYPVERLFIKYNKSYFTEENLHNILNQCGFEEIFVEKMEYPLEKIKHNILERAILKGFYFLGALLHRQAQITIIARK